MENYLNIPNHIFLRLYLYFSGSYRKFYWLEMKDSELYWGNSDKKSYDIDSTSVENAREITIKVPENLSQLPLIHSKFSYHKSGQVHSKKSADGQEVKYKKHSVWKLKEEITEPVRFYH